MLKINNYSSIILKGIDFLLEENENLIILGDNGAGKSTLAKVLCNLIKNNNVKVSLEPLSQIEDKRRVELINYIPPTLEVFDEYLTAYEFLELSFLEKIDKNKLEEIIIFVGIKSFINQSCLSLSSGEKKLLLLASSLIHNAKITIFDELSANMDISRVKEVYSILKKDYLKQKIIITHNLDLAFHLKYKILYLKKGEMQFFGSSEEFFEQNNLNKFYNNSLKIINDHLVVNL